MPIIADAANTNHHRKPDVLVKADRTWRQSKHRILLNDEPAMVVKFRTFDSLSYKGKNEVSLKDKHTHLIYARQQLKHISYITLVRTVFEPSNMTHIALIIFTLTNIGYMR